MSSDLLHHHGRARDDVMLNAFGRDPDSQNLEFRKSFTSFCPRRRLARLLKGKGSYTGFDSCTSPGCGRCIAGTTLCTERLDVAPAIANGNIPATALSTMFLLTMCDRDENK